MLEHDFETYQPPFISSKYDICCLSFCFTVQLDNASMHVHQMAVNFEDFSQVLIIDLLIT